MSPEKARAAVKRHLAHRAAAEATRSDVLPALRVLGAERFGSVVAFADALANESGITPVSARGMLYANDPSRPLVEAALRLLGLEEPSRVAA